MPYMGGKRKIAGKLMDYICAQNPNAKYFYDLFGGGGAMSFEALQRPQFKAVTYNEFNTGVVEVLKKIRKDGVTDEFYKWIDRETFMKHKNDDDWYGGLCKVVWSFGNNQRSYLFGKPIEETKRKGHEAVVNGTSFDEIGLKAGDLKGKTINERRLEFGQYANKMGVVYELQQLERLQQLQQLEQLQQLDIQNKSYEQVKITTPIDETVIYLDPPYEKTAKYQKSIDHKQFDEWVKNHKYKIYISSYDSVFPAVFMLDHRSTLSAKANNKVTEKLFCNKTENNFYGLFGYD